MTERTVTMTDDDVRFVEFAKEHYQVFAEAAERQHQDRTAGIMRRQEFHAERFLTRIYAARDSGGEG
jgi:hypothetical protein